MPTVRHPKALDDVPGNVPSRVTLNGEDYAVADDGTVELGSDHETRALANAHGVSPATLREDDPGTIDDAIEAGECPWCDEYSGEHVGQHASSAHPDKWDAHTEDD